jgi:transposase InsO family protein
MAPVAVDNATRRAHLEALAEYLKQSVIGFLSRAIAWFNGLGLQFLRMISDKGPAYVYVAFAKAFRTLGLRHIGTSSNRSRTNGNAERFMQTLSRQWAYALVCPNSQERYC